MANSILQNIGAFTGSVPKAVLFISKRKTVYHDPSAKQNTGKKVAALRKVTKRGKGGSIAKRMKQMVPGQVLDTADVAAEMLAGNIEDEEIALGMASQDFLRFDVQYNPNTISFRATAGQFPDYRPMGDSGAKQYKIVNRPATTYMEVQLIFEDVNVQDAFMHENLNPTASNVTDMASNIARTVMDDNYSVREEVEGLCSLLMMENTRRIVFFWSDMFFHGVVDSIDANYTMFNKIGEPIKATVNLTIRQAESGVEYDSDNEYWKTKFEEVFEENSLVSSVGNFAKRVLG